MRRLQQTITLKREQYEIIDQPRRGIPWRRLRDLAALGSVFVSVAASVVFSEVAWLVIERLALVPVVAGVG